MTSKTVLLTITFLSAFGYLSIFQPGKNYRPIKVSTVDTAAPQKEYNIKLRESGLRFIDSILMEAHQRAGRSMTVDEAEPLKQGIINIIMYFRNEKMKQDSVKVKK